MRVLLYITEKKELKKAKTETVGRYAAFIDYGDDSDGEDAHKKKKAKTVDSRISTCSFTSSSGFAYCIIIIDIEFD